MTGIRHESQFMASLVTIKTTFTHIHRNCKIN